MESSSSHRADLVGHASEFLDSPIHTIDSDSASITSPITHKDFILTSSD